MKRRGFIDPPPFKPKRLRKRGNDIHRHQNAQLDELPAEASHEISSPGPDHDLVGVLSEEPAFAQKGGALVSPEPLNIPSHSEDFEIYEDLTEEEEGGLEFEDNAGDEDDLLEFAVNSHNLLGINIATEDEDEASEDEDKDSEETAFQGDDLDLSAEPGFQFKERGPSRNFPVFEGQRDNFSVTDSHLPKKDESLLPYHSDTGSESTSHYQPAAHQLNTGVIGGDSSNHPGNINLPDVKNLASEAAFLCEGKTTPADGEI
ncbi:hypothetical protein RUND412_005944 [Rhizina undulata]